MVIIYVFAVIATNLFAAGYPEWFGYLSRSLYTLIPSGVAAGDVESFPYAWAFFILFILVATCTRLNLFIAIIVHAMQTFTEQEQHETVAAVEHARQHIEADLHAEVHSMRDEIRELKNIINPNWTVQITAMSQPEPFTHNTWCVSPTRSVACVFTDVLPPPCKTSMGSRPSSRVE